MKKNFLKLFAITAVCAATFTACNDAAKTT